MCCGKEEGQGWSRGHTDVSLGQAGHRRLPGGVSHYLRELGRYGRTVSRNGQPRFQKGLSGQGRVGGRGRESEGAREPPSRAAVGARKFLGLAF